MPKLAKRLILPTLLVAAAILFVLVQRWEGPASPDDVAGPGNMPGGPPVPAFTAYTLSGNTVGFPAGYQGKLVLLDFWATWCAPCVREIPNLVETYNKYHGQGFEILGVTLDGPRGARPSYVQGFVRDNRMTWEQVYRDAARIATAYRVTGIPAGFLVDGDTGQLLASGDALRGRDLRKTVEQHLQQRNKSP